MKPYESRRQEMRARLAAARAGNGASAKDHSASIERINELTRTARGIWFGLLAYLVFVSVTLMGVKDVDFFLTDQQTKLPIVDVPVPTFLFMALAPLLGAILYSYFHLHLLKLWEKLSVPPPKIGDDPLSDHIAPWLVSDIALAVRGDGALRERPLRLVSNWVNILFAFLGTPIILAVFWFRSAPPHFQWLTLVACGVPFLFTTYVGMTSWRRLKDLCENPDHRPRALTRRERRFFWGFALVITLVGWFRVEGSIGQYAIDLGMDRETVEAAWWAETPFPWMLSVANLANVNFSGAPADWLERDADRQAFRPQWCQKTGLPAHVCGPVPDQGIPPSATQKFARQNWCDDLMKESEVALNCVAIFGDFEARFKWDWQHQRDLQLAGLRRFDLAGMDLRNAILSRAQMQGINLGGAQMQGANLRRSQMQGAFLFGAQMQGANLFGAQMQRANLRRVQMQEADLGGTQMQGALLGGAQMQGANLGGTQMDSATSLTAAILSGAALRDVDYTDVNISQAQVDDLFYDGSVRFSETIEYDRDRPEIEDWSEFHVQWHAWQKTSGNDPEVPDG